MKGHVAGRIFMKGELAGDSLRVVALSTKNPDGVDVVIQERDGVGCPWEVKEILVKNAQTQSEVCFAFATAYQDLGKKIQTQPGDHW